MFSTSWWIDSVALYGSTITSDTCANTPFNRTGESSARQGRKRVGERKMLSIRTSTMNGNRLLQLRIIRFASVSVCKYDWLWVVVVRDLLLARVERKMLTLSYQGILRALWILTMCLAQNLANNNRNKNFELYTKCSMFDTIVVAANEQANKRNVMLYYSIHTVYTVHIMKIACCYNVNTCTPTNDVGQI